MKKILLAFVMITIITALQAQRNKKSTSQSTTGYAVTAAEKGGKSWKEVRLIDVTTGSIVKTIYESTRESEALNARTGKAVVKKDPVNSQPVSASFTTPLIQKKVVNLDAELNKGIGNIVKSETRTIIMKQNMPYDKPFATNSAALAYDKKHERLYYTPMNIGQLRYIDLRSGKI